MVTSSHSGVGRWTWKSTARTATDHIGVLKATLLLLAGGASRRMGQPKALLPYGRITLAEHIAQTLAPEFDEVLVSANDPDSVPLTLRQGYRLVADLHVGAGPLAGIEAGLNAARNPTLFAVACDMPLVTAELAGQAVAAAQGHDAAVPRLDGRPEPAAAAYRQAAAGPIAAALAEGRRKAADVLEELDVAWLDGLDPRLFANANDPAAYRALLDALR
jgi:molybdopterin-guanine dinucleotide biosynthesis protein A